MPVYIWPLFVGDECLNPEAYTGNISLISHNNVSLVVHLDSVIWPRSCNGVSHPVSKYILYYRQTQQQRDRCQLTSQNCQKVVGPRVSTSVSVSFSHSLCLSVSLCLSLSVCSLFLSLGFLEGQGMQRMYFLKRTSIDWKMHVLYKYIKHIYILTFWQILQISTELITNGIY